MARARPRSQGAARSRDGAAHSAAGNPGRPPPTRPNLTLPKLIATISAYPHRLPAISQPRKQKDARAVSLRRLKKTT